MTAKHKIDFLAINNSLMKMIHTLGTNEKFLKYARLMVETPLASNKSIFELKANLISDTGLYNGLFNLQPSSDEVVIEERVYIFAYPLRPSAEMFQTPTNMTLYVFDIIVPNQYFLCDHGTEQRAMMIAHEMAQTLDGERLTGIGEIKFYDFDMGIVKNTQKFSALSLVVGVNHATIN